VLPTAWPLPRGPEQAPADLCIVARALDRIVKELKPAENRIAAAAATYSRLYEIIHSY
jgi:hypothetical protein